jgi:hypothetical protein
MSVVHQALFKSVSEHVTPCSRAYPICELKNTTMRLQPLSPIPLLHDCQSRTDMTTQFVAIELCEVRSPFSRRIRAALDGCYSEIKHLCSKSHTMLGIEIMIHLNRDARPLSQIPPLQELHELFTALHGMHFLASARFLFYVRYWSAYILESNVPARKGIFTWSLLRFLCCHWQALMSATDDHEEGLHPQRNGAEWE